MWQAWIEANFAALREGARLQVPQWLTTPSASGFTRIRIADPAGQIGDWAIPLKDGSRIHIHEFPGGRFVAHRDKYDPDRGLSSTIAHLFSETGWGIAAILAVIAYGALSEN